MDHKTAPHLSAYAGAVDPSAHSSSSAPQSSAKQPRGEGINAVRMLCISVNIYPWNESSVLFPGSPVSIHTWLKGGTNDFKRGHVCLDGSYI